MPDQILIQMLNSLASGGPTMIMVGLVIILAWYRECSLTARNIALEDKIMNLTEQQIRLNEKISLVLDIIQKRLDEK
jgi:hypothetical protein